MVEARGGNHPRRNPNYNMNRNLEMGLLSRDEDMYELRMRRFTSHTELILHTLSTGKVWRNNRS